MILFAVRAIYYDVADLYLGPPDCAEASSVTAQCTSGRPLNPPLMQCWVYVGLTIGCACVP